MIRCEKCTVTQKKWLLTLHILFAAIMFGVMVAFLILGITAANTTNVDVLQACYNSMHILAKTSVRASTIGTLVTGILLAVLTKWGLFKFYWIIAKELLVIAIGLGVFGMHSWTLQAITLVSQDGAAVLENPSFIVNNEQLFVGIVLQIISLVALYLLSVFKPWGLRKKEKKKT